MGLPVTLPSAVRSDYARQSLLLFPRDFGLNVRDGLPLPAGLNDTVRASPTRAVLVGEWPAFFGGSWHPVVNPDYPNAKDGLSFVDGHAGLTKIYWDGGSDSDPCSYEPPAGYDYTWDGE